MFGENARPQGRAYERPERPTLLGAAAIVVSLVVPIAGQSAPIHPIVAKASTYVAEFIGRFSRVVAEERYVQDSEPSRGVPAYLPGQHRELVADFLLVKADKTSGWITFRDVFEVNRVAVRDHQERLTKLFLESPSTAFAQADAITRESARYNIGPRRTVNNPLLALAFLQDSYRSRFSFSVAGQERIDGVDVTVVEYRETERPTFIRGGTGSDLPARRRYWIDEPSGSVLKAELSVDDTVTRSKIVVTFRFDERLQLRVPVQMEEEYIVTNGATVWATARYGRFRQFDVKTDEGIR